MVTLRFAAALVGLFLIGACGSPSTAKSEAAPSSSLTIASNPASPSPNPPSATSPASPALTASVRNAVLVGHWDNPATVVLMRQNGSIVKKLAGVGVVDQHAVGAYLVVAGFGSSKGWTVDASGVVRDVAPAAVAILAPSIDGVWTPPLIVDSTTAVTVRCTTACTADEVNLRTGAVRPLVTAPYTGVMTLNALTVLDVSSDRKTVWLSKITSTGGGGGLLEILGIDLRTGKVSSQGRANSLAGAEIAITQDGKMLAGQEEFETDSTNIAIRHLHVVSLGTKIDSDVQGTAPYIGGQRTPSVLFAPGGAMVAWWGGLNGDKSFLVNVAPLGGKGRTLYYPAQKDFSFSLSGVLWVDSATLVVQNGVGTYTINATTGRQKLVSQKLNYLDSVLN
jgi:hypothetical protein